MASIVPYKINVPEEKIQRLKTKIAAADFPDEVPDVEPWSRGTPLADLKRLADYWQNGFDWRKQEAKLNELPQYMTQIDVDNFGTYDIHFVHQPSPVKNAIPLLFCHGWPGSFAEITKILPKLINGGKDAPSFHVVVPSMVDFGFSARANKVSQVENGLRTFIPRPSSHVPHGVVR
jgi:Epoxide hydrolase N terminus